MQIKTVSDLREALKQGNYSSVGSYPLYFITSDGGALKPSTVKKNIREVVRAIKYGDDSGGWRVVAIDVNWENPDLYDDDTGARIESAYAED